jgi:flagellar protein FliS
MYRDPSLSYRQASALGASPVGLVVALYDTILRDFFRALAALQAGDVETRVQELNHALTVIAHLQNVLDFKRGGEAATQLERFYTVTRGLIVKANFLPTPAALEELIELYGGLREAWSQAEHKLPADQAQAPPAERPGVAPSAVAAPPAFDDGDTHRSQWSG